MNHNLFSFTDLSFVFTKNRSLYFVLVENFEVFCVFYYNYKGIFSIRSYHNDIIKDGNIVN